MPTPVAEDTRALLMQNVPSLAKYIAQLVGGPVKIKTDEITGYYDLKPYFDSRKNGLRYSVLIPKFDDDSSTACIKTEANAGMVCIPSTNTDPGQDDYYGVGPFNYLFVNGTADPMSGVPYVWAVEIAGDGAYTRYDDTQPAMVATPVLYWSYTEQEHYYKLTISDTHYSDLDPQPGAKLPDGSLRDYILYAEYPLGYLENGGINWSSISGVPTASFISHNSVINLTKNYNDGLCGKTHADDWYIKVMHLIKNAEKSSQKVYSGCTSYNYQYKAAVASSNTNSIVLTDAQANNILVGSQVYIGEVGSNTTTDRGNALLRNISNIPVKVLRKTSLGNGQTRVYVDTDDAFDSTTTTMISTMGWPTGACDNLLGTDGAPDLPTSGRYPFRIQGIEAGHGFYEIIANIKLEGYLDSNSVRHMRAHICYDSNNLTTSNSADSGYTTIDHDLPCSTDAASWFYTKDIKSIGNGLLVPDGHSASSSTGTGDGWYSEEPIVTGFREWRSFGSLDAGALAGLFCVGSNSALSSAWWHFGCRLSALGRSVA